jgi:hypothetical protein
VGASSWLTELQNVAFRNAAPGKRDWVSALIFIYGTASFLGIFTGILTLIAFTAILFLFVSYRLLRLNFLAYVDTQLNASFWQRLDAISPHVDSVEERRLRSQWALMTNREDYDRIKQRLEELATAAQVSLPKPLYP